MILRQSANSSANAGEPALLNASNELGEIYTTDASRTTAVVVSQSSDRLNLNQCQRSPMSMTAGISNRAMLLNLASAGGSYPDSTDGEVKIDQQWVATHAAAAMPSA